MGMATLAASSLLLVQHADARSLDDARAGKLARKRKLAEAAEAAKATGSDAKNVFPKGAKE
eukprot:CAMPEP_0119108054 /NCGR_PEP_ID=MMETSP1180-20130426/13344_1 /TAXON_ID=3052 ORGANISM="Chlamydomonas cf sp, Strain CCMP681" /NCGR_SAMPLE_ID=MMETSP1180 /ASSEMBLY_ACC=CAM_ASM_000741 /LENGTH=60 /DNA_ID=CAMNT_0007093631 /DNA_START=130 /DNA_END=312 /DNA_ORIENTATION=+